MRGPSCNILGEFELLVGLVQTVSSNSGIGASCVQAWCE